jgi:hypothetical protein
MTPKHTRPSAKTAVKPKIKLTEAQRQRLITLLENHLHQSQPRRARKTA